MIIRQQGEVFPCIEGVAITGYFARVNSTQRKFENFDEALVFTRQELSQQVASDINAAGAYEAVVELDETEVWSGMVKLSAWAIGKPGLDGNGRYE